MRRNDITVRLKQGGTLSLKDQVRTVFTLSVPAILEQVAYTMMSFIDTAMVGSLGRTATASISLVSSTVWLLGGINMAAAVGFSVQVAQYLGAGRQEDAQDVLRQAMLFNAAFGALLAALAFPLGRLLPWILGAEEELRPLAGAYLTIVGLFLPFSLANNLYASVLRCCGNTKAPGIISLSMCLLNALFNFLLIFPGRTVQLGGLSVFIWGAGMGVHGAALGTGLSTAVTALLQFSLAAFREPSVRLRRGGLWRFSRRCMTNMVRLALPVAFDRVTMCMAQIVQTAIITSLGAVSLAAHYIAVTAEAICYMPSSGVSFAATTLVGQAIGANRRDMAKRFAYLNAVLGFGMMLVTSTVLWLFAPRLVSLFTPDREVLSLGARVLRIVAFSEPLFGLSIIISGALRGAGDTRAPFLINLASMWGVRIAVTLLYARRFGLVGVWTAMTVELLVRGSIFLVRLLRGKWLGTKRLA